MGIVNWDLEEMLLGAREMKRDIWRSTPRRFRGIGVMLVCVTSVSTAHAADYRYGYSNSYRYPYSGYGVHENFRLQKKIDRMVDQMRRQQKALDDLQEEQARLLRQQQSAQHRVTAKQACYYRYDGGLDLCDRLFDTTSREHAACAETVVDMNPGCAEDIARSTTKSGR